MGGSPVYIQTGVWYTNTMIKVQFCCACHLAVLCSILTSALYTAGSHSHWLSCSDVMEAVVARKLCDDRVTGVGRGGGEEIEFEFYDP